MLEENIFEACKCKFYCLFFSGTVRVDRVYTRMILTRDRKIFIACLEDGDSGFNMPNSASKIS